MAYLDDYPNLCTLQRKYGVHTAPIAELREAARLDGYSDWSTMCYERDHTSPPQRVRQSKKVMQSTGRLRLFDKFGIGTN